MKAYRCNGIRSSVASLALLSVLLVVSQQGQTHGEHLHTAGSETDTESIQQFAVETLRIPDVPVIDTSYQAQGFVSRFAHAGTIVISLTYTGCETLCPISNLILQQLDGALAEDDALNMQIVTLSIDPEADTPETLKASAKRLNSSERWTWLTATSRHNRMLLDSLDVDVKAIEAHDPMFLVGRVSSGRFIRVIGMPDPEQLLAIAGSGQF